MPSTGPSVSAAGGAPLAVAGPALPAASPMRPLEAGARLDVLRSVDELRFLRAEWAALESRALEPNPFFGPGFLLPLLEARGSLEGLAVLICRDAADGELLGLLPTLPGRLGPRGILRTRRAALSPAQPHGFLATPLLREDRAETALDGLLDAVDRGLGGARLLELVGHAADGAFADLLAQRLEARRQPALELDGWTRRLFRRRASDEAYLAEALGAKHRAELRRQRRQLERRGRLVLRRLAPDEPVASWVRSYLELEAAGWKGRSGTALALHPGDRAFFEAMCRTLHGAGMLAFDALELDSRPIAIACSLRASAAVDAPEFVFKITYDEAFARQSPGMQLQLALVTERHGPGASPAWVDSCAAPGDTLYRQIWLDERRLGHVLIASRRPPWPFVSSLLALAQRLRQRRRRSVPGSP